MFKALPNNTVHHVEIQPEVKDGILKYMVDELEI